MVLPAIEGATLGGPGRAVRGLENRSAGADSPAGAGRGAVDVEQVVGLAGLLHGPGAAVPVVDHAAGAYRPYCVVVYSGDRVQVRGGVARLPCPHRRARCLAVGRALEDRPAVADGPHVRVVDRARHVVQVDVGPAQLAVERRAVCRVEDRPAVADRPAAAARGTAVARGDPAEVRGRCVLNRGPDRGGVPNAVDSREGEHVTEARRDRRARRTADSRRRQVAAARTGRTAVTPAERLRLHGQGRAEQPGARVRVVGARSDRDRRVGGGAGGSRCARGEPIHGEGATDRRGGVRGDGDSAGCGEVGVVGCGDGLRAAGADGARPAVVGAVRRGGVVAAAACEPCEGGEGELGDSGIRRRLRRLRG